MLDNAVAFIMIFLLGYNAHKSISAMGYRTVAVWRYNVYNYAFHDGKRFLRYLLSSFGPFIIAAIMNLRLTALVLVTWFFIDSVTTLLGAINYRKWSGQ